MEIPNMKDDQRFPPLYRARRFPVFESGGFVSVSLHADAAPPPPAAKSMHLFGTIQVSLDHQRYMEALYDDPGLLIHVRGVTFTPYLMSESRMQDGWLVMERCCQWGRSEEHTSELQSLMRISYADFCLYKKNSITT